MTKLVWDAPGSRFYETGVKNCALYPHNGTAYDEGVAWNGITSISESPDGAEANDLWADDMKYATLRSAENLNGTIEAYTYPDEFALCDGTVNIAGISIGMQPRKSFGLAYITQVGNDTMSTEDDGEMLHLIYGATASPSDRSYETINDSPDAITFSWEFETTPLTLTNSEVSKPTSILRIDSTRLTTQEKANYKKLKCYIFGSGATDVVANQAPTLLLPDQVIEVMQNGTLAKG